jgi:erythritol/L-threitol dehydrogenase
MKALRMHAPHDFRLENFPVPSIKGKEILIRVEGCGICAGDIKTLHGGIRVWGTTLEDRYIQAPVIGGHEFFGEVVEIGDEVEGVNIGDKMVSEQIVPCGKCRFCLEGNYWVCQRHYIYGFKDETQGGFAEYMKFNENGLNHKVPESFSTEQGVLIEPFACSMHAVERGKIEHNDIVVISGLGTIGLGMISIAYQHAPKLIIGIDIIENKLELAKKFGADIVLNPIKNDVVKKIKEVTEGYGCDLYIEASGNEKSVHQGLNAIRFQGRYVQFGVFPNKIEADWNVIGDGKEIEIYGSHLGPYCYEAVIRGIDDKTIKTEGVVTHEYRLDDWKKAFETAEKDPSAIKVMLVT